MNPAMVSKFIESKCRNLDGKGKSLVKDVLLRIPDYINLREIFSIEPVYCGAAYRFRGEGWLILLDWNVIHKGDEARDVRLKTKADAAAKGVIASNLAHYALKHSPSALHAEKSLDEAEKTAIEWGFRKEILEMTESYL